MAASSSSSAAAPASKSPDGKASSLAAVAKSAKDVTDADLRRAFAKIDSDANGKLSKAEIVAFFKKHGRRVDEKDIDDAITFADSNKDGQVDLNEFVAAFLSALPLATAAPSKSDDKKG